MLDNSVGALNSLHTVILLLSWFLCIASAGIFLSSHSPDSPFVIYNFTIIPFTTNLLFLKATNLPALEVLEKTYLWTSLVAHLPSSLLFHLRLLHYYCLDSLLVCLSYKIFQVNKAQSLLFLLLFLAFFG